MPWLTDIAAALILFIFAVTSSSDVGWGSARVLAPLIISIFMVVAFFLWEARIPFERAAVYVPTHCGGSARTLTVPPYQASPNMVPAQLRRALRRVAHTILLVEHGHYDILSALAAGLRMVCAEICRSHVRLFSFRILGGDFAFLMRGAMQDSHRRRRAAHVLHRPCRALG